jgi:type I restriction enzyme R subunit
MGNELAKAVAVKDTGLRKALPADVDELVTLLAQYVTTAIARFDGVDRTGKMYEQLMQAQDRILPGPDREAFAEEFLRAQGLFEFLWPDTALRPIEDDYMWLARIYASIQPTGGADALLWHRLGAKTVELVHQHLDAVTIDSGGLETVAIDAGVFEALRQLGFFPDTEPAHAPTVDEVIDKLEQRLARKLAGKDPHHVWRSLAAMLEDLRRHHLDTAVSSVEFLKSLLDVARQVVEAERAEHEGRLDSFEVLDPDKGALTQILQEYAPENTPTIIENVVEQIVALVRPCAAPVGRPHSPAIVKYAANSVSY